MKVLLIGSTWFVGAALLKRFNNTGLRLLGCKIPIGCNVDCVNNVIKSFFDYFNVLENVSVVVHCVTQAHVMAVGSGVYRITYLYQS